ncbi:unnamed protein product [Angiostrongylus costaricensis]|uniref:PDZ domain-containing protein n=1 Tax=Angiostrongylus costaricensis TaxID=334426 RepID=A0A0R3PDS7_ANGCS|nr:unnamed protein product [Angiostrongylus costaricensis]
MGDRIFAVNGHNIIGESHKKVVERIKENALRCEMLVISEEGAQWYNERGVEINLKLPNIQRIGDDANRRNAKANGSPPPAAGWYAPSTKVRDFLLVTYTICRKHTSTFLLLRAAMPISELIA